MKSPYWLLAGLLLSGSVQAIPHYGPVMGPGMGPAPYGPGPMAAPQMAAPAVALRTGMDRLLAFLGNEQRPSADELAAFLSTEIAPFFDFEHMAKSAGGRLFENLNDEGRREWLKGTSHVEAIRPDEEGPWRIRRFELETLASKLSEVAGDGGADLRAARRAMVEQIQQSFLGTMAEKLGGYEQQQVRFLPPRGGQGGRTAQVSVAVLNPGTYPARLDFRLYRNGDDWLVYDVSANGQSAIVHYRNQLMREAQERRMQQMRRMQPPGPRMGPGMPPRGYGPGPGPRY